MTDEVGFAMAAIFAALIWRSRMAPGGVSGTCLMIGRDGFCR